MPQTNHVFPCVFPFLLQHVLQRALSHLTTQVQSKRMPSSSHQPWFLLSPLLQRLPNAAIMCLGPGMQPPTHTRQDVLQAAVLAPVPTERKGHRPRVTELAASQDIDTALSCSLHLPETAPQLGHVSPPLERSCCAHPSEVVRQHRPPAAERNAEQEHMQITEPFCTASPFITCNI